jgi:hexosaminidase
VSELPRDAIALEWGYEAGHPFADHARHFAESGLDFYVSPGTSSWQSIAGRTQNALANLRSAAVNGKRAGARGYLATDWGDRGHLQPFSASYLGIAAASHFAWNAGPDAGMDWPSLLDAHVIAAAPRGLGRIACDLGDAYLETGTHSTNGSALFFLLAFADEPLPHARMPGLEIEGLARALEYTSARRRELESLCVRGVSLEVDEMCWAAELSSFACRLGIARLGSAARAPGGLVDVGDAGTRSSLADELQPLIEEHRRLWSARNRPGGSDESAGWLTRIAGALRVGL